MTSNTGPAPFGGVYSRQLSLFPLVPFQLLMPKTHPSAESPPLSGEGEGKGAAGEVGASSWIGTSRAPRALPSLLPPLPL